MWGRGVASPPAPGARTLALSGQALPGGLRFITERWEALTVFWLKILPTSLVLPVRGEKSVDLPLP